MLLERDNLLSELVDLLDQAADGTGCLVLLAGEAGAGKTSLVNGLVDQLTNKTLQIRGACDPLATPRPLSPLYDFVADPQSGLNDLDLGEADNMDVFNEVLDRLRHSIRPVLMVIEDIHWADQVTLDFIRYIGRRISTTKAVFLCTYRNDEVGPEHTLRSVLGQLFPLESTKRIEVPLLSKSAVATLAEGTSLEPDRLHHASGGNAFFVTEVIAAGESVPPTVQDAVLARLARLEPGQRDVIEAVSIAPRSLEVDRALLLAGGSMENIDMAASSGLVLGDGRSLRFRHELARSAVERAIPPARRHVLHHRMLALLLEEDPPDHARLAHHAIGTADPDMIVENSPLAARNAAERGAHKEAVEFYEAALEHSDRIAANEVAAIRLDLAIELRIVDRQQDSLAQAEAAASHYEANGNDHELARALGHVATARWTLNDRAGARTAVDDSVDLLEPMGPSRDLAHAHYRSAHFHMLARHAKPAMRAVEAARTLAAATQSHDVAWSARMLEGCVEIVAGRAGSGMTILEETLREARSRGNQYQVAIALSMLGTGGGEARRYGQAIEHLEASVEQGLIYDEDYAVAYSRAWLARVAFEQGRWDDAVALAELVDKTAPNRVGVAIPTAIGALGRVRVRRGDPGAQKTLQAVVASADRYEIQHVWSPISGLAEYHWLRREFDLMPALLSSAYERALDTDSEWARGEVGFWMWKAGAIDAPPDNTAEPFRLQMEGRWREAADAWHEIGCPYEVAMALADGDEEALLEALEVFDGLGAKPMSDRLRDELRGLGAESVPRGPTRATRANPAGLTDRQLEVLELMTDGLSNAEIAENLFISKKTAEHHVSAIYSKLGVSTRAKAIAAAHDEGLIAN